MIDFCEDFQVNGHFSVFHEISGIFRTFPQPPAASSRDIFIHSIFKHHQQETPAYKLLERQMTCAFRWNDEQWIANHSIGSQMVHAHRRASE